MRIQIDLTDKIVRVDRQGDPTDMNKTLQALLGLQYGLFKIKDQVIVYGFQNPVKIDRGRPAQHFITYPAQRAPRQHLYNFTVETPHNDVG